MPPDRVLLGRKRPVPSCPNPLFLQWLTELRDHAKENNLKTQYVYQKAITSLKKYPLPLKNGKEAKILQNFGDGICKILDERLQKHCRESDSQAPLHKVTLYQRSDMAEPHKDTERINDEHMKQPEKDLIKKKATKGKKVYVPQKRSGGYAVMLTLYRHVQMPGNKDFMFRDELQSEAQVLCDKSFTVPDLGSRYTAWSSVKMLIQKDLLVKTHNPARYSLTGQGLALAEKLDSGERGIDKDLVEDESEKTNSVDGPDVVDLTLEEEDDEAGKSRVRKSSERPVTALSVNQVKILDLDVSGRSQALEMGKTAMSWNLPPGSYEIVLCVDFIETTGGSSARKQELVKELQKNGVTFNIRKLNVGDFLWVARERVPPVPGQLSPPVGKELVLDYIIERKRMDDLCGSIIDGRFREQKFRLKRCGLRKPIYLIEECGLAAAHYSLPESTLQQAVVNTQVVDGFFVKHVQDVKESAAYLTIMTRYLQKLYQNCTLFCHSRVLEGDVECEKVQTEMLSSSLMSFAEFNYGAIKNKCQTVREVFARQLMQISGVSGDKAAAVLELYGTVNSLMKAYDQCSSETEKEKLLSSVKYGKLKRNLGPALSRTIYQLYCTHVPLS